MAHGGHSSSGGCHYHSHFRSEGSVSNPSIPKYRYYYYKYVD